MGDRCEALDRDLDLIVTLDDATGAIYSAILFAQEGTASSFLGLGEKIAKKGLFRAFYTDRGSHYFHTPKAGGKVDKTKLTQVGRALQQWPAPNTARVHSPSMARSRPCCAVEGRRTRVGRRTHSCARRSFRNRSCLVVTVR